MNFVEVQHVTADIVEMSQMSQKHCLRRSDESEALLTQATSCFEVADIALVQKPQYPAHYTILIMLHQDANTALASQYQSHLHGAAVAILWW